MLRAVTTVCIEGRALELVSAARRKTFSSLRRGLQGSATLAAQQTVLSTENERQTGAGRAAGSRGASEPPPPPPPPPSPPRRAWPAAALAAALTASLGGGVYFYRRLLDDGRKAAPEIPEGTATPALEEEPPIPASGSAFPAHVQYLLVGGGTAAFAAMRAIRSARPDARVLLVSEERALPYMRPPLSKELWREPDLAQRARYPDSLTFRQWNGKRRPVVYEPEAFYMPVEELEGSQRGGAAVARGWRVARLDVAGHAARLEAPGRAPRDVSYDKVLVATGVRARRAACLRAAAAAGRSLALRSLRDAARLAERLDDPAVRTVAVLGGGFLATELSAALADRLSGSGRRVVQVMSESAPMEGVLPGYLARDAGRRLEAAGVELRGGAELAGAALAGGGVQLRLEGGGELRADLVVECVGSEPDTALAAASGLELHPSLGGLLVNAELAARADVYAAGDAACFYDVALGRRRVEHHDHAVVSGRLAGENMAAVNPPKHYTHQSMFWSDLGPQLGYEAIGIIDSRLPTVGIFSADAVAETAGVAESAAGGEAAGVAESAAGGEAAAGVAETAAAAAGGAGGAEPERRYERGVVFYLRERRVVGVLLWNLFNRMHVARQVLAEGEFDDLLEVGKLFAPHEED